MDTSVANAEPVVAVPETAPAVSSDPFSLDEARLASLSPEQRAALDPVFEEWKGKAKLEIEKSGKTYEEKYKPHVEKAEALERLAKDPRFQQWWNSIQQGAINQNPQGAAAVGRTQPTDFASPEEWQNAMAEAYGGDPTKLKDIQQRMFAVMATPVITQLREGQQELKATLEMKDLFERHTDARELDQIGRDPSDPKDQSESLLESCLDWADKNGKSFEEGYQRARRWADSLRVGAKQEAMGMVQDKKQSVTSGPSTNKAGASVIEVEDVEELMNKSMQYQLEHPGQPIPRFVVRKQPEKQPQWAQRG